MLYSFQYQVQGYQSFLLDSGDHILNECIVFCCAFSTLHVILFVHKQHTARGGYFKTVFITCIGRLLDFEQELAIHIK